MSRLDSLWDYGIWLKGGEWGVWGLGMGTRGLGAAWNSTAQLGLVQWVTVVMVATVVMVVMVFKASGSGFMLLQFKHSGFRVF